MERQQQNNIPATLRLEEVFTYFIGRFLIKISQFRHNKLQAGRVTRKCVEGSVSFMVSKIEFHYYTLFLGLMV